MTLKRILIDWAEKTFPEPLSGDSTTITDKISRKSIRSPGTEKRIFLIEETSLTIQRKLPASIPINGDAAEKWRDEILGLIEKPGRLVDFHFGNEIISQISRANPAEIRKIRSILLVIKVMIKRQIKER